MIWGIVRAWLASKDINVCILQIRKKTTKKASPYPPLCRQKKYQLIQKLTKSKTSFHQTLAMDHVSSF